MLLCRCINLLYAYIINVLCVCGLSVSDRVESGKVWARAALLVKAADAICKKEQSGPGLFSQAEVARRR